MVYGGRVNYKNLFREAVDGRQLIRALAYVVKSQTHEEEGFFDMLAKLGYEVKSKDLQIFAGGAKKGDWDVGMAMDAIKLADKLDVIVLVTGDGDFVPLVVYLQENKGCQVEVMGFAESSSARLTEVADDFYDLGEDPKKFLIDVENHRR